VHPISSYFGVYGCLLCCVGQAVESPPLAALNNCNWLCGWVARLVAPPVPMAPVVLIAQCDMGGCIRAWVAVAQARRHVGQCSLALIAAYGGWLRSLPYRGERSSM
jgi:hypothetical protein